MVAHHISCVSSGGVFSKKNQAHIFYILYPCEVKKIYSNKVTIKCCPTNKLVDDFSSKPVSGEKFKEFRAKFMNMKDEKFTESYRALFIK